jgi:hypothetical protein
MVIIFGVDATRFTVPHCEPSHSLGNSRFDITLGYFVFPRLDGELLGSHPSQFPVDVPFGIIEKLINVERNPPAIHVLGVRGDSFLIERQFHAVRTVRGNESDF